MPKEKNKLTPHNITHRQLGWLIRELKDSRLKFGHLHLIKTAYLCLNKNRQFQWSQKELARVTGMGKSTIFGKQKDLEKWGYFQLIERGSNITHEASKYQMNVALIIEKTEQRIIKAISDFDRGLYQNLEKAISDSDTLAYEEANAPPPALGGGGGLAGEQKQKPVPGQKILRLIAEQKEKANAKS